MENNRTIEKVNFSFGFTVGCFVAFFILALAMPSYFEKPWDTMWTSGTSIFGTIVGSVVGGVIAYSIAIKQATMQQEKEHEKEKQMQKRYAERLNTELIAVKGKIQDLGKLLEGEDFENMAQEISKGESPFIEGILLFSNQIETELLMQLRTNLIDLEYTDIHKTVEKTLQIKQMTLNIPEQKSSIYIKLSLDRVQSLTEEVVIEIEKLTPMSERETTNPL